MITTRTSIDRMTMIGLAVAALLPFLALSPADAATAQIGTASCAVEAQAIRAEAATATPQAAAKALHLVSTAQAICAEGNRYEAAKKLAQARQQLGTPVQLADRR